MQINQPILIDRWWKKTNAVQNGSYLQLKNEHTIDPDHDQRNIMNFFENFDSQTRINYQPTKPPQKPSKRNLIHELRDLERKYTKNKPQHHPPKSNPQLHLVRYHLPCQNRDYYHGNCERIPLIKIQNNRSYKSIGHKVQDIHSRSIRRQQSFINLEAKSLEKVKKELHQVYQRRKIPEYPHPKHRLIIYHNEKRKILI